MRHSEIAAVRAVEVRGEKESVINSSLGSDQMSKNSSESPPFREGSESLRNSCSPRNMSESWPRLSWIL